MTIPGQWGLRRVWKQEMQKEQMWKKVEKEKWRKYTRRGGRKVERFKSKTWEHRENKNMERQRNNFPSRKTARVTPRAREQETVREGGKRCKRQSSRGVAACCSVAQSCSTLCNPLDCSMPGFPDLHYLPKFAHILWVNDEHPTISSSVTLFSLCPRSFPAAGSFPWVGS